MSDFNLPELFKNSFGYKPSQSFSIADHAPAKQISGSGGSSYYANDMLGREMFMPITLFGYAPGIGAFQYVIPFATMNVNAKKIIIQTPMPERSGAVLEFISINNFAINIKGIVITDDNSFPESQIKILQNIFIVNQSIRVTSVMADIFLRGEQRCAITEMKWPAVAGTENARPFEIDCVSDSIFDLN